MKIVFVIIFIIVIWIFLKYRKIKCLAKVRELIETDYIKQKKEILERTLKNSHIDSNIDFKNIYKTHFKNIIKKAEEKKLEYINSPIFSKEIEVCIQVKYSWINTYYFFKDEKVSKYISIVQVNKEDYTFHIRAETCSYLWLTEYIYMLHANSHSSCYDTKEILESLDYSLSRDLVGFSDYKRNRNIVWSINKILENFEEKNSSYLLRLLELLKYNGEHYFDDEDFKDIKLFTGKEIKEINYKIEIFFINEILKHNFKYIIQLENILRELESKNGINNYDVKFLNDLQKEIAVVTSSLNISIEKNLK